jgi:hypothetical protein
MTKTLLSAAVLALVPAFAWAQCSGQAAKAMDQQAMSCLPGTAFDAETGTCVPQVSS